MKQTLRHIFLLLALFIATKNAWAECYVLEKYTTDNEGYITVKSDRDGSSYSESFPVSNGYELTFSYRLSGSTSVSYDHYVAPQYSTNGSNFSDILPENTISTKSRSWRHTKDDDKLTFILPSGTTHIRFRRRASSWFGTRDVHIKNVRVTRKSFATVSPTTFSFDPIPVGTTATKKVTINYSNIGTRVYASACDPADVATHFALTSAENLDCTGSVELILTYQPQSEGNHGGTATISGSNGISTIITISGSAYNKVNPTHTWSANTTFKVDDPNLDLSSKWGSNNTQGKITYSIESFTPSGENNEGATTPAINGASLSLGQAGTLVLKLHQAHSEGFNEWTSKQTITINKYDVDASICQSSALRNEIIGNPFSLSYGLTDFIVESKNTNIAEYHESTKQIQTYFTDGTASFQVTRPEDYKYNALNQTLTLTVKASTASCDIFTDPTERNFSTGLTDFSGKAGYAYEIPENVRAYADSVYITAKRTGENYFYLQYSTNGGAQWTDFPEGELNLSTSYQTFGLKIPEGKIVTHIRPFAKTGATLGKDYKDFRVTRKQFLNPQIDGETFYLTQVSSGMQFAGTFPLAWSTCSDEIRFSCDNPNFTIIPSVIDASNGQDTTSIIVTYSANTDNPNLTGELTIYDQSQTKTITLSCEHLTQTIDWPQYFHNLEADEEGVINQDFTLNAIARAVNGQPTNQPIKYTLSVSPSENAQLSSDGRLIITGICEGTITASVEGFTDATSGITYSANSLTRQIRIRKAGDPCNSYALSIVNEQKTDGWGTNYLVFPITGLPESTITFGAHADVGSVNNYLYIDFHTDANAAPNASGWSNRQTIEIKADNKYTWGYTCTVPENAKQVRFETVSSLNTYFNMVTIRQKEYLTASVSEIVISDVIVNQPFSATFTVDYSDVPFIQYEVTNNHNLNIQLTPSPEINNNCGEYGTYTFTLTGMSPYPQENVQETITIFTSAGHRVEIPVIITSKLGDSYYFKQQDGNWSDLNNWQVNGIKPSSLPTPSNPVYISKAATVGANDAAFEGIAYSITIETGGSINVLPQGGLTVHAGGFTGADENNLTLHNKKDGAGFIRISPYCTNAMPTVKVLYETTSTLDEGANELAVWQYIGAPGTDCQFTVDYITWLYHWSEKEGWINKTGTLTLEPFAGYAITQYGKPTYELVSTVINKDQTITLTKTDTGNGMKGDNLFSNSYMTPIDVKNFKKEDFEGDIEATFYLFNSGSYSDWADHNNNNNTLGDNHSVSPGQYCAIPALAAKYLPSDFDITTIPPMQGVYVIAKENNAKIHLNYNKHVWNAGTVTTDMHEPMRAPIHNVFKPDNFRRLRIQINSANSGADRMYVIQDTITTTDYDNGYDAPNQLAEGLANIYTNEHFGQMEVSCSNHIDSTFVGFTAGLDSIYTLRFNAIIGDDLHLLDLDNDSIILIEEDATYTFHATPHSKNDLRFQILLHPEKNLDFGKEEKDELYTDLTDVHTTQVWSHGSCIYINNVPANTIATLYNISGHKLLTTPIHHTPYTLDLSYLPKGVYMLQLNTQVYKFVIQ